jgi:hypothetical protein
MTLNFSFGESFYKMKERAIKLEVSAGDSGM